MYHQLADPDRMRGDLSAFQQCRAREGETQMTGSGDFNRRYGPWALVTGASSGMGAEFARQLAARGMNLVLVARREQALADLKREIEAQAGVQVRTLALDLTDEAALPAIVEATQRLDIGLLVPCAGVETHGSFLDNELQDERSMMALNMASPLALSHHFTARMAERGHGGVIFVAATLAYQSVPYFANYAATKAYVLALGEALHVEMKGRGIDVTVLSPGLTSTDFGKAMRADIDFSKMPMTSMEAGPVVASALAALGRKASVIPGRMNRVMAFAAQRILPRRHAAQLFGGLIEKAMR